MKYSLRPGLVLEHIYEKHLLIADEEARKHCAYLTELDQTAAAIIERIMIGTDIGEMATEFSETYHSGEEELEEIIKDFLQQMYAEHFLVKEMDGQ